MDFAFSALLIYLIVLPGIILRYGLTNETEAKVPRPISDKVAESVVVACGMHFVWCLLAAKLGHPVDFNAVLTLLFGHQSEHPEALTAVLKETANSEKYIFYYFGSLYAVSALIGSISHRIIRHFGIDLRIPALRLEDKWFYYLTGEYVQFAEFDGRTWWNKGTPDLVFLTTVICQGDKAYLYRGYVIDFEFNNSGGLELIVLGDARRRELSHDLDPHDMNPLMGDANFYEIVGDLFVLRYDQMQTVNIQCYFIKEEPVKPGLEQKNGAQAVAEKLIDQNSYSE